MRHKRLSLIGLLLLGLGLTGLQAQNMYVKETGGAQTAYSLSSIQKMGFSSGYITVSKTTGAPDTYALSNLRYLSFVNLSTAISAMEKTDEGMLLYPNPVADLLNIQLANFGNQPGMVDIYSIEGKVVLHETINLQGNGFQLNVSALPKGLYLCKIVVGATVKTTRFIKQ